MEILRTRPAARGYGRSRRDSQLPLLTATDGVALLSRFGHDCPDCGGPLVFGEGCALCPICGHSLCT